MDREIFLPPDSDMSEKDIIEIEKLASLGELIGGISHELNNPLSAILGYSEILQSLDIQPEIKKYIKNIHIAAMRSAKIVEGLLTFLRKRDVEFNAVNINDVIKQTVSLFEYQMRMNNISLVMELAAGIPHIRGDFYKLQQVFFNLIMNALQALEGWHKDRRIVISSDFLERSIVRAIVSDSGPGIASDNVGKIFSPFFTTKPKGTGLGLSIVQGIIKDHSGSISVFSGEDGCFFAIDMPAAYNGMCYKDKNDGTIELNRKVLIVDNDELVLDAFSGVMEFMGCDVVFTTTASEGLIELKKSDFDFIFIDYRMPDMKSIEFIEKAAAYVDTGKIILITADVTLDADAIRQRYNIPVLQKPISMTEIKKILSG